MLSEAKETDEKYEKFEGLGYESAHFLTNMGSLRGNAQEKVEAFINTLEKLVKESIHFQLFVILLSEGALFLIVPYVVGNLIEQTLA